MLTVSTARRPLRGEISVPGDKSISHRAVMLGALAEGLTEITGFLPGADCLSTIKCMTAMGAEVQTLAPDHVLVRGRGAAGLQEPQDVLDAGNSGTTTRLLTGILAGQNFHSVITGDASIRRRPMDRITVPLRQMGAQISGRQGGRLCPLAIQGAPLRPIHYQSPVASAQVKSSVLLAGLYCDGVTAVTEPLQSRDHSERMLAGFGATVAVDGLTAAVHGRPALRGQRVRVPGDISSAAFFLVAASIVPDSEVVLRGVGVNPTRTGILDILATMGASVRQENLRLEAGEPVADLIVRGAPLQATEVAGAVVPRAIDELPVVAVAALFARGTTVIRDAQELRVKETDRIAALAGELRKLGAVVEERPDGMAIEGGRPLRGAAVDSHLDHRLAMALAVAALGAAGEVRIAGEESIVVSFPGFSASLATLQA